MSSETEIRKSVDRFIIDTIDSVPHLEALLLLWREQPKEWSAQELADVLFVDAATAEQIFRDLTQRKLAVAVLASEERYVYNTASEERNRIVEALSEIYRRELVRVSTMIHKKAPAALREFAKAFRFTKDS